MKNDQALDQIAQLPNIAWPAVKPQVLHGVGFQPDNAAALLSKAINEALRQPCNIRSAITKWGYIEWKHIETVVQVHAELTVLNMLLKVLVCRRNDPDVALDGFAAAHTLKGSLLQNAK